MAREVHRWPLIRSIEHDVPGPPSAVNALVPTAYARPRSVTADKARARSKALGCSR